MFSIFLIIIIIISNSNWTEWSAIQGVNRIYNKILNRDWFSARLFVDRAPIT